MSTTKPFPFECKMLRAFGGYPKPWLCLQDPENLCLCQDCMVKNIPAYGYFSLPLLLRAYTPFITDRNYLERHPPTEISFLEESNTTEKDRVQRSCVVRREEGEGRIMPSNYFGTTEVGMRQKVEIERKDNTKSRKNINKKKTVVTKWTCS
jgi:hypothetical protein